MYPVDGLLDNGDYHPTEMVNDKIFALLAFLLEITLHVTQPVRWDFAHVVLFDDEAQKIVRCGGPSGRVDIAWDYFDASINRLVAWGIGCL